jgi:hypothetical protein
MSNKKIRGISASKIRNRLELIGNKNERKSVADLQPAIDETQRKLNQPRRDSRSHVFYVARVPAAPFTHCLPRSPAGAGSLSPFTPLIRPFPLSSVAAATLTLPLACSHGSIVQDLKAVLAPKPSQNCVFNESRQRGGGVADSKLIMS